MQIQKSPQVIKLSKKKVSLVVFLLILDEEQ